MGLHALVVPVDWRALAGTGGGVGGDVAASEVWSFGGAVYLRDAGGRPVTLRSAELVGLRGITPLDVLAYDSRRSGAWVGGAKGFPPEHSLGGEVPVSATSVPAGKWGVALTFGMAGVGSATGFAVTYEVDGRTYRQVFTAPMEVFRRSPT